MILWGLGFPPIVLAETALNAVVDSAVRLVSDQIHAATAVTTGNRLWTSQPGALRRFVYPVGVKIQETIYKLYSSPQMIGAGGTVTGDLPANWQSQPENYVDLNAPVVDNTGAISYPIADPRADAEGFTFDPTFPGAAVGSTLPMPVRWLYLLKDGTLGTLNAGIFQSLHLPPDGIPSATNPIISRVAFWTDDLTCKININTASEGVFWDTPRCDTNEERDYGKYQPVYQEYQREMGHPAAVCLSSVLFPGKRYSPRGGSGSLAPLTLPEAQSIWNVAPSADPKIGTIGATKRNQSSSFYPEATLLGKVTQLVTNALPTAAQERVQRGSFFLTAKNRAPDYSAPGQPRMSLWPIPENLDARNIYPTVSTSTRYDLDMRASAVLNNKNYFLIRNSFTSNYSDFFSATYYGRPNSLSFTWLQGRLGEILAGQESSLSQKYSTPSLPVGTPTDASALALLCLDYIRDVNPYDALENGSLPYATNSLPIQPFFNNLYPNLHTTEKLWATALPFAQRGMSQNGGISEIILWCTCRAQRVGTSYTGTPSNITTFLTKPEGTRELELGFLAELSIPRQGPGGAVPMFSGGLSFGTDGNLTTRAALKIGTQSGYELIPLPAQVPGTSSSKTNPALAANLPKNWTLTGGSAGPRVCFTSPALYAPIYTSPDVGANFSLEFVSSVSQPEVNPPAMFSLWNRDYGDLRPSAAAYLRIPKITVPIPELTEPMATRLTKARQGLRPLFDPDKDIVRTFVPIHGDYRMVQAMSAHVLDATVFSPHPRWNSTDRIVHSLTEQGFPLPNATHVSMLSGITYPLGKQPDCIVPASDPAFSAGRLDGGLRGACDPAITGDWDNGTGPLPDGPWANFPDEGDPRILMNDAPYFGGLDMPWSAMYVLGSPHRMIPSAVMFGSLPTGTKTRVPWQTLLFRPDPNLGTVNQHYGSVGPKDHLLLDLFRMPVVIPWKISDPLSKAGAINLNYQMLPFSYITRTTALHALFKAQKLLAIPSDAAAIYKTGAGEQPWRHFIDPAETLKQWEARFTANQVFHHASEICEQWLVPEGETLAGMPSFWAAHRLTGDNSKERPYASLYPHLTTRSNSFLIHVIAQQIEKSVAVPDNVFDPLQDRITATQQEAIHLEQSINASDPNLPDYVTSNNPPPLETFSQLKVLSQFSTMALPELFVVASPSNPTAFEIHWTGLHQGASASLERSFDLKKWSIIDTASTPEGFTTITPDPKARKAFYRLNLSPIQTSGF